MFIRGIYLINRDFRFASNYMIKHQKQKWISILEHKYRSPLAEHSWISQFLMKSANSSMHVGFSGFFWFKYQIWPFSIFLTQSGVRLRWLCWLRAIVLGWGLPLGQLPMVSWFLVVWGSRACLNYFTRHMYLVWDTRTFIHTCKQ